MTRTRKINQSRYNREYYQRNADRGRARKREYMRARRAAAKQRAAASA